jgi:O-acetyl-ADP-ribose deacetylase
MISRLKVIKGDITQQRVDAIVNAANNSLLGGGGVDGAIHWAAGPALLEECRKLNGCKTGEAKITGGHNLPAHYVIHTVGPIWRGGNDNEDELLASCYQNSLALAVEHDVRTIAFPSISTGAYRFPVERASLIAVGEIAAFLRENSTFRQIIIVCFNDQTYEAYSSAAEKIMSDQ